MYPVSAPDRPFRGLSQAPARLTAKSALTVHFLSGKQYEPILQKRSGLILSGQNEHKQYNVWREWVFDRLEELWTILNDRYGRLTTIVVNNYFLRIATAPFFKCSSENSYFLNIQLHTIHFLNIFWHLMSLIKWRSAFCLFDVWKSCWQTLPLQWFLFCK